MPKFRLAVDAAFRGRIKVFGGYAQQARASSGNPAGIRSKSAPFTCRLSTDATVPSAAFASAMKALKSREAAKYSWGIGICPV